MVQNRRDLSPDVRRKLLGAVLGANREPLAELRERGHGAAVEAVEGLFAEALGAHATMPAAAE